jgi:outer membrane protein OmpA-like peptidoglycan-associated protein
MSGESNQTHWIPLSDLMTGMMLVFMLIAIVYMVRVQQVATELRDIKGQIYTALDKEFGKDLKKWDAEILPNLTFRFKNPDALFPKGKAKPTENLKLILDDFFPRYLKIIKTPKFQDSIKEVLIEGHTDIDYDKLDDDDVLKMTSKEDVKKYMNNMTLSVNRSWMTLSYLFDMVHSNPDDTDFLIKKVHIHAVSSAYPIIENGQINAEKSRRVELKIITNSDERLEEIADQLTKK